MEAPDTSTIPPRYQARVRVSPSGCMEWTGSKSRGYGYAHDPDHQRARPAHRVIYEAVVGRVPQGLELDHLCRNRACVNPAHMEPVTHLENVRRGAVASGMCKKGLHPKAALGDCVACLDNARQSKLERQRAYYQEHRKEWAERVATYRARDPEGWRDRQNAYSTESRQRRKVAA